LAKIEPLVLLPRYRIEEIGLSTKLGTIGGGVMGEALLSRLIALGAYLPEEIMASDRSESRRQFLRDTYRVRVTSDNLAVANTAEVLVLAVKPQVFTEVVADLATSKSSLEKQLIISILAGVSLSQLEWAFPKQAVIRAMPNTPATVGGGITAIARGSHTTEVDIDQAKNIFQAVGEVVEVPETLMDAVTGVSGSGPAYVAIMVEALADGGVAAGLPRNIAYQLALQTVLGTAQLLHGSKMHPAELKDRVASPGGTTIAGISSLERNGFRSALIEAVIAATERSRQLGKL
jgi:pyrroline-5-carboxylate reductase